MPTEWNLFAVEIWCRYKVEDVTSYVKVFVLMHAPLIVISSFFALFSYSTTLCVWDKTEIKLSRTHHRI